MTDDDPSLKGVVMRSTRSIAALLVFTATVCCVSTQPKLSRSSLPTSTAGYVGAISTRDTIVRFGFGLCGENEREYILALDNGVELIELPPGVYHVCYWVTWGFTGEQLTRRAISVTDAVGFPFEVAAGKVMLLGKWFADRSFNTYTLQGVRISRQEAAAALRESYRGFASAPVECLVCGP